jgi:hypothetical protein
MGLLSRLLGGRIDPDAVPPGPFAALPFQMAQFGRKVIVRVCYSPHPKHLFDVTALHRAAIRCVERAHPGPAEPAAFWDGDFHRFKPLCRRLPGPVAGAGPVWAREFHFRSSDLPPDYVEGNSFYPLWLKGGDDVWGEFLEPPAATPTARATQRAEFARRRGGQTVRAVLVQANGRLFSPGRDDLPCLVLFSLDPRVREPLLEECAGRVAELKGTEQADPEMARVARMTTDERFVYYGRESLPRSFTGGREVFAGQLMVHRRFLPDGYLTGGQHLDCVAEPGPTGALELLPSC